MKAYTFPGGADVIADALVYAAEAAAAFAARARRRRAIIRRGDALHPGPGTPLWNELARQCKARLRKRGDKVNLARNLGISRQRLHLLLVRQTACADSERTLQLFVWLVRQQRAGNSRKMSSIR